MQNKNVLTVSQVNNYVTAVFKAEELLQNIAISGEVANFSVRGEYAYFSIKDENSLLSCVCFSLKGNHIPRDGESVLLTGSVTYYVKTGKISFIVRKISALGQGALFARFTELKERLQKEGIFSEEHKKKIPLYPMNVGVITSKTGAVIRDIKTTVRKNNPRTNISVFDVRVQGEGAPKEIIEAIKLADSMNFDVLIVARGGGSFEDLLPFYDEGVTKAVYNTVTPIISAVGHEVDVTFCDFAADLRVATPTAAGEAASFNYADTVRAVKKALAFIGDSVFYQVEEYKERLKNALSIIHARASTFITNQQWKISSMITEISNSAFGRYEASERTLERLTARISLENPLNVLKKGAFFAFSGEKMIKEDDVERLCAGDKLRLVGNKHELDVVIENKHGKVTK